MELTWPEVTTLTKEVFPEALLHDKEWLPMESDGSKAQTCKPTTAISSCLEKKRLNMMISELQYRREGPTR